MSYSIASIGLEKLGALRNSSGHSLQWLYPFVFPIWLDAWWGCFGDGREQYIQVITDGEEIIGIAPLMVDRGTVFFMGDVDVCDYQDFVIRRGHEQPFFRALCSFLVSEGISRMELKHVRPDSTVISHLVPYAQQNGFPLTIVAEDTSMEMTLPDSFDEYLRSLNSKQRHEVRRKLRRINEAGEVTYRLYDSPDDIRDGMEGFYRMFVESRDDKADFLTDRMREFFDSLTRKLSDIGILRLGVLKLDNLDIATVICFDYDERRYLYNCGYHPDYTGLSAGLVGTVKTIEDSIERGLKTFDFLKGNETYKSHLGGSEIPLSCCRIEFR